MEKSIINSHIKLCHRTLKSLEADIEKVDNQITRLIKEDQNLNRLFQIITSVPGIGKETAVQIMIITNEFQDICDPKKFACYAGVVPFTKESGKYKGKSKVSFMANKTIKTLLHLAALCAIQYNTDMKAYFDRKILEGKNKMSLINAVRNKLIHRVFNCVTENRKYENNYITVLV